MFHQIGDVISENRKNQGMTQEEFASRVGVTAQAVSKWERGTGMPDIAIISGICNVLHIDANTLLGVEVNSVVENHDKVMAKEIKENMFAAPIVVEFGINLVSCFAQGLQTDIINLKRCELVKRTGMLMPLMHIRDNVELNENEIILKVYDVVVYRNELQDINESSYEILMEQIFNECEKNYVSIINKQIVKTIIDNVKERYPGVIEGLVPEKISYLDILKYLREMVEKRGNIRDIIHILEELEEGTQKRI